VGFASFASRDKTKPTVTEIVILKTAIKRYSVKDTFYNLKIKTMLHAFIVIIDVKTKK
jgi:hypothetical protein